LVQASRQREQRALLDIDLIPPLALGPGLRVDILVVRVGNDGQRLEDLALDEQLVASGHVLDQQVLTWWVDVPGGPGDLVALNIEGVDPLDHRGVDEDREERNRRPDSDFYRRSLPITPHIPDRK